MEKYKHLFGPVFSRRIGRSLGVDLVPHKTCSLDCVYCECGPTTDLTLMKGQYVSTDEVINELNDYLGAEPELDFVTFSGAGEPTLHEDFFKIVSFIKNNYPQYKLCLLTNSVSFTDPEFLQEMVAGVGRQIDLVVPSLDAISEACFQKINQPAAGLTSAELVAAVQTFASEFPGEIWMEVFIIPGVNDTVEELTRFRDVLKTLQVARIQLNCLDRPAAYKWVKAADGSDMAQVKAFFDAAGLETTIIGKVVYEHTRLSPGERVSKIRELISRRPCTLDDLAAALDTDRRYVELCIASMKADGEKIEANEGARGRFYKLISS